MAGEKRLETLARLGFAARGVVYLLIGWFALQAAVQGGRPGDSHDALSNLADGGAGRVLLGILALGLFGYGIWRVIDAALDRRLSDGKDVMRRLGHAISGIAHVVLGVFAASLALKRTPSEAGQNSQDASARDWTGWLLEQPFGETLVILLGLGLIGVGIYQGVIAYRCSFMRHLGGDHPPASWLRPAGRLGFAARGLVFLLIGAFIASAGWRDDASEAGSMAQALRTVQDQPSGPLLLGITALGLMLFGLFSFVEAKYRRIDTPDLGARLGR